MTLSLVYFKRRPKLQSDLGSGGGKVTLVKVVLQRGSRQIIMFTVQSSGTEAQHCALDERQHGATILTVSLPASCKPLQAKHS